MPDGSGSGSAEVAVAAGLDGGWKIEVGVGTGGIVSVGEADPAAADDDDGTPALGATLDELGGTDSTTDTGFGARGTQSVMEPDAGEVAVAGAVPKAPAPPGALTGGGAVSGVPSVQPTATANGRPRATTPKKTDLGESRTP